VRKQRRTVKNKNKNLREKWAGPIAASRGKMLQQDRRNSCVKRDIVQRANSIEKPNADKKTKMGWPNCCITGENASARQKKLLREARYSRRGEVMSPSGREIAIALNVGSSVASPLPLLNGPQLVWPVKIEAFLPVIQR
jgi:hypothetical protein